MHRVTSSFRLPLVGVRVPLSAGGVRLIAALTVLAGGSAIAAIALVPVPAGRVHFETPIILALGALTVLAAALPLLDGAFRPLLVGIPSVALALVAAAATGLAAEWPAPPLAWLLVIVCGCAAVYHLLGRGAAEREE